MDTNINKSQIIIMTGGENFIINIFFIPLQFFSYQDDNIAVQDDNIAVTIDTFE